MPVLFEKKLPYKLIRKPASEQDRTRLHQAGDVIYLTFPALEQFPWLRHGFSTRFGGVSEETIGPMNLGYGCEKDPSVVQENIRRMASAIGFSPEQVVYSRQTHTINCRIVTKEDMGYGYHRERPYDDIDGLMTNEPEPVLVTFYADCVPLLIVDPVHRAIAGAHSGWRGTVKDMGGTVIRTMQREYGTKPEDVVCVIGPSICQDCYEVSEDVIDQFRGRYDASVHDILWYETEGLKYQLNLQEACRQNFLLAGVPASQIHLPDLCTCCNPWLLHSHRASKGVHGNMAAFLQIC